MEDFVKAAKVSDVPSGDAILVEVGDERILLSNIDGHFYAVGEICTHAEAYLSDGDVEGEEVECYLHGSRFNLKTGEPQNPPANEPLPTYSVRVEADDILIGPL